MPITENRTSWFTDRTLNLPENRFSTDVSATASLEKKLAALSQDTSPLEFASPLYNPLTPELLSVVHTPNNPETGGFQGKDVRGPGHRHGGLDIKADPGMGVMAAEDGVIVLAGTVGNYGNVIYVNHRDGYQTRYAHLGGLDVKEGDVVKKGELIGTTGTTGNGGAPGVLPHLHFEVRKIHEDAPPAATQNSYSTPENPLFFIVKDPKFYFEFSEADAKNSP